MFTYFIYYYIEFQGFIEEKNKRREEKYNNEGKKSDVSSYRHFHLIIIIFECFLYSFIWMVESFK